MKERLCSACAAWLVRLRKTIAGQLRERQQLTQTLREAEQNNLIDPDTLGMMEGAMQMAEMRVRDIMFPAAEMVAVGEDQRPEEFLPIVIESGHSRFPVVDEDRRVQGVLLAKDLLEYLSPASGGKQGIRLREIMRRPYFVPESKRLTALLRELRASRNHLAIVVDEYGGTAGIVTIEDVIEQIVGEIDDEHDIDEEGFIREHRGRRYIVKARTPIEEFNEYFDTHLEDDECDTFGGLVLKAFGHLPRRGESVDFAGFNIKVLRADKRRIHLLRLTPLADHSTD